VRLGLLARRVRKGRRVFRVLPGWVLLIRRRWLRSMICLRLLLRATCMWWRLLRRLMAGCGMTRIRRGLMLGLFRVHRVFRDLSALPGLLDLRVSRVSLVLTALWVLLVLLVRRVSLVFRVLLGLRVWMAHRAL